ncbi:hypothetical protein [Exiguobacterium acetylicum]|uniref:hypothetical protein n=1 Tax=Exiguobacterium acetylicum TaxID=41170 RepID=UPI0030197B54
MSKKSKQQPKQLQEDKKPMQHYLYADMDFINSYLAQSEKGLHLTSRHTNSNTDAEKEERSSSYIEAEAAGSKEDSPNWELGLMGNKLGLGGDQKMKAAFAATTEGLNRGENSVAYSEQAIEVALHDYAINLFIESIREVIRESNNNKSVYFLSSNTEWDLLDYSDTLSNKLDAYVELINSGFLEGFDKKTSDAVKVIAPQAKAILKVMNSTFPTPYAIRKNNRQGNLDEKWMRYSMKSLINDFGMKPTFSVLGIRTSSSKTSINENILQQPQKLMNNLSQYLDQNFLPAVTESTNGDHIFKPIIIFRTLE